MINLIPPDFTPSGIAAKLGGLIKNTGLVLFAIFIVVALSLIGVFVYFVINIQNSRTKETQLKNSITQLESTEQKLILIKDRITYADSILIKETSVDQVDKLSQVMNGVPGVRLIRSEMIAAKNDLTLSVGDLVTLKNLFAKFKTGQLYANATLGSFNFSPTNGYQVGMNLSNKKE